MTCFIKQSRTHQKHDVLPGVGTPEEGLLMTHISGGQSPPDFPPRIMPTEQLYGMQVNPPNSSQPHPISTTQRKLRGVGVEREEYSLFRLQKTFFLPAVKT